MKDKNKTKEQLIDELAKLRQRIVEVEKLESERKQAEARYQDLVEKEKDIIYTLDNKGYITFSNPAVKTILGYREEELIGKHFMVLIPKELQERTGADFNNLLKIGEITAETTLLDKKGQPHFVEYSSTVIKEGDKVVGTRGIVRDITERRWAEEELREYREHLEELIEERTAELKKDIAERIKAEGALRESEARYRNLVETIPYGIQENDNSGIITFANTALCKIMGHEKEKLIGMAVWDLLAEDSDKKELQEYLRYLVKEQPISTSYIGKNRTGDGREIIVQIDWNYKRNEKKQVKGFISIITDITNRIQAEQALKESEKRFRNLVENANDSIYIITPDGFEYVNPAFEELTGYVSEEVYSKKFNFWNTIHPDDIKLIKERETARKRGEELPSRYEFRVIAKDGKTKTVESATVDIGERGEAKVLGILRDTTERKKADEKIKTSLKEKEVMLKEIHHRVRNNMQIMSSLLRLQSVKIKDKKIQEMFKASQTRIRSMALIHERLHQSKDLARINFAQYIQSLTVHLFQTYRVDTNIIKLKTEMEDVFLDINTAIPCSLIINELVSNSLKYAFPRGKKGEIDIKLHRDKQGKFVLIVKDNGVGFPEYIDYRKPDTLGLQLVNDLVKQVGGTIKLRRIEGTEFKITF